MNIPVVLPVVAIEVDETGGLTVRLDGQPYAAERSLHRSDLQSLLDEITHKISTPVRVEVTETDGTTYADISTPPATSTPSDIAATEAVAEIPADGQPGMSLPGVRGAGFRPGERVAVAYVLMHETADDNGAAVLRLPPAVLARYQRSLMLLGLDSKTLTPLPVTLSRKA